MQRNVYWCLIYDFRHGFYCVPTWEADANIDRRTGFFNSFAFAEYLKQKYREGAELSGMLVTFEDSHTRSVPTDQVEAAMLEIAAFMRRIPEARIFKTDDKEFTLVLESREALERAFRIIDERFQGSWLEFDKNRPNISLQPYYVKVPSEKVQKILRKCWGC